MARAAVLPSGYRGNRLQRRPAGETC